MWIQTAASPQHPRQSRARPSGAPGAPAMRIPHPTTSPRGWSEQPLSWPLLPIGLAWVRGADGPQPGLEPWERHPPPHTRLENGAGSRRGVAAPHFCPPFHLFVPPRPVVSARGHPSPPPSPGGETRGPPPPAARAFKTT